MKKEIPFCKRNVQSAQRDCHKYTPCCSERAKCKTESKLYNVEGFAKNGITFKRFHIIDTDRLQQQLSRTRALKIQYFNLAF